MKPTVLALAAFLLLPAGLARADALADAVKAMPAETVAGMTSIGESEAEVTVVGPARRARQSGSYRVIVVKGAAAQQGSRLFVQWVSASKVESSLEIPEFAELKTDVAELRAKIEQGDLSVFIDVPPGTAPAESYELFITGPRKYRFGRSSN